MKQFDLNRIKHLISEKYQWGPSSDWTNFHFKELSKAIEEATGSRISGETLKRIFGKRKVNPECYQPQAFSQLVLMKFAESLGPPSQEKKPAGKLKFGRNTYWAISLAIVVVSILLLISQFFTKAHHPTFSCKNAMDYMPFTASFEYDISGIKDSVFCDFGMNMKKYLPPGNTMINYFYKKPGLYNVRFYTPSKMLDSLRVIVYSTDWQGGYFPNDQPDKFQPFYDQTLYRLPDCFYASPAKLKEEHIDLKENYWTCYKFFSPFNKSLDRLSMEAHVLNNESTGSYLCYDIDISLIGDSGLVELKFTQPKCSRYAKLIFSEKKLNGEFYNLDAMTVDLSDWLKIKIATENNRFNLYLSDTPIFKGNYQKPMGNLLGIVFSFYGSGKIDFLELKDTNGDTYLKNDFSK